MPAVGEQILCLDPQRVIVVVDLLATDDRLCDHAIGEPHAGGLSPQFSVGQ
jgi:hypothetical protein